MNFDRLYKLLTQARDRKIECTRLDDPRCFRVTSYSDPRMSYGVFITDGGETRVCGCMAKSDCTHIALALYDSHFLFWHYADDRRKTDALDLRRRIYSGRLSRGEKRMLKVCMREVEARFDSETVAA